MSGLSDLQKNSLLSGFIDLDRRLADLDAMMYVAGRSSPLSGYALDLSPVEMGVIRDYCQRMRSAMNDLLTEQQIERAIRPVGLRRAIQTHVIYLHVSVGEIASDKLRGYGRLSKEGRIAADREAFRRFFFTDRSDIERRIVDGLRSVLSTWNGNLAVQARRYEAWMSERLLAELAPLLKAAVPLASEFVERADNRFGRVVEAFRNRLNRNIEESMGVEVSPVSWEACHPQLAVVPVSLGQTFMTHWDLLWWVLPMPLVGALFRRHVLNRVPWELEKNLFRLTSDWTTLIESAVDGLRQQAAGWVEVELATMRRLLERPQCEAASIREALDQLIYVTELVCPERPDDR